MKKITPFIWYDFNADEAIALYKSIFKDNMTVGDTIYYEAVDNPEDGNPHAQVGKPLTIEFEIFGQSLVALNGGPQFPLSNAVSLMIDCKDQAEIDYYWDAFLQNGGEIQQCGWLFDKFGLPWQICPGRLLEMHKDKNPAKRKAVMESMMQMVKLDLAELERVYAAA